MTAIAQLNLNTPDAIIRGGLFEAQLLEPGSSPTSEQLARGMEVLNQIVQFHATQGMKLFLWQDLTGPLVAGQASYTITANMGNFNTNPLQAREVYYLQPSGAQYPLTPFSWNEWSMLSERSQQGVPVNYFLDKQSTAFNFWPWPIPDANGAQGVIHTVVRVRPQQMVQLTEQTIFPPEWAIFLRWAVADEMCTGQPQGIITRCREKMEYYRTALEGFDVEDQASTQFQVSPQMGYGRSRFR